MVAYYAGDVLKFYCGTSSGILPISGLSANNRMLLDMNMDNNTLSVTLDDYIQNSSYSGSIQNNTSVMLFANSHSGTANQKSSIKLYSCQIYDNNILVRNYVPAKQNGVYGLWDKKGKKFYSSASNTQFIGG